MGTSGSHLDLDSALSAIPKLFRTKLLTAYLNVKSTYTEGKYDTCILKAGRFCEVMLRILQKHLTGSYIPFTSKIKNYKIECENIERLPRKFGPEGLRILMPRALLFLYSIRNKRDAGHVGGEVDANAIDAAVAVRIIDWCTCELLRTVHTVSLEEAQSLLDSISSKQIPEIWSVMGRKRVLRTDRTYGEKTLLLLYSEHEYAVPTEDLFMWTEHPSLYEYKRRVLTLLHDQKLVEYDMSLEMVVLSPLGVEEVEKKLVKGGVVI